MSQTLVLQSHTHPLPVKWLEDCIQSVKNWAEQNKFDYQFIGDELFGYVPNRLLEKTFNQRVIATDLARLKLIQEYLRGSHSTVIWCDADFLIFAPDQLILPQDRYAVGREVWIQQNEKQKLKTYLKVHNAFMMFRRGNTFLDFYADTAERLLTLNNGPMPTQFIGPKLLTAIHNIVQCPVLETAGMLSPLVIKNMAEHTGAALDLFRRHSPQPIAAANLCSSLYQRGETSESEIECCIQYLHNF